MVAAGSARRLVLVVAGWQLAFALAVALPLAAVAGMEAGWSALLGGAIAALGSAGMALGLRSLAADATPGKLLKGFIVGEVLKFAITIILFAAVILTLTVRPL